jgi:aconitase B
MAHAKGLEASAEDTYRYLNFDQIERYQQVEGE